MLSGHSLEDGRGKNAIARKPGIRRDTIHRPIRTGEMDRAKRLFIPDPPEHLLQQWSHGDAE